MNATDSQFYTTVMANLAENIRTYVDLEKQAVANGDETMRIVYQNKIDDAKKKRNWILDQWNTFSIE